MDKKITVACVLWEGDFRTRNYNFEWVKKLKNMVARNLTVPHDFVCLTNAHPKDTKSLGITVKPLVNDWPGWWSKLELFRPGLFEGHVLYLDLDMVIIRNIDDLINHPSPFKILKNEGVGGKITKDGMVIFEYNSSVMSFVANSSITKKLYSNFNDNDSVMKEYRGDQDYIAHTFHHLDTFRDDVAVKLKDCPSGMLHETAKIVLCMPFKNDVAAHKYKHIKEVWK